MVRLNGGDDPGTADTLSSEGGAAGDTATAAAAKGVRSVGIGDVLGRYELIEEIGEGGMATVYRARDRELRREVAVKVLFPHLAKRAEVRRRFHREARAAAKLEHDNILRIYDVGDDPPHIVMELVRGQTLLEVVGAGMLAEIVACIGALLAEALAVAHAAGIVHRDIKPANVLVAPGGRLLLADFGVARLDGDGEASLVTKTGALLGTPAYMSPEQATGEIATAQSDLYSLGATLYQLATGALPYSGSPAKVLAQIATGSLVAPVRRRGAVGPELSRAIEDLMATDASRRPESAKVVAAELRAVAAAGGLGEPAAELAAYFADPAAYAAAKTPAVVAAVVARAKVALAEGKLPRAMALADRASALAPGAASVKTLVDAVTAGGRTTRRRRVLVLGGVALAVVGGGAAIAVKLTSAAGSDAIVATAPGDAIAATAPGDAEVVASAPGDGGAVAMLAGDGSAPSMTPAGDAGAVALVAGDAGAVALVPRDANAVAMVDAGAATPARDAGAATLVEGDAGAVAMVAGDARLAARDGGHRLPTIADARGGAADPAVAVASAPADAAAITIDAAPTTAPAADAFVIVRNDVWCDIEIDGAALGRRRDTPLRVPPGHHTVTCRQAATGRGWSQDVDVAPGATRTVTGTLQATIEVHNGTAAPIQLGTQRVAPGGIAYVKADRYEVATAATKRFLDIHRTCTIREAPELDCY